ncbi:RNA polymerase factor sigma-54 [Tissierella praeacuta]|uniref:RNA polymerase factor sigma-54 n=1 Tax=Tissierella praeacuta TaxID=43131 RepID=UPI000E030388|nr:RNA polymerase factor sigma-54 [Tissierella praeacuta]TCU75721.1 RNA polymerase RpoN-/SigL-like sigma 54 subunit [Tissierella praeacuta]SUP00307.1 RNA polymerase factor sigma-54 [Tissierella praeacuta]
MRLSYDLTLEQSQKLIMTPELRQAIELLQFNSLELKEYIANEMEENPMLESLGSSEEFDNLDKYTNDNDIDWKEYFEKYDDISYRPQIDKNIKEYNYEAFVSYEPTLKEHLMSQLRFIPLENKEYKIGENIIQNIDENGYLSASTEEIAKFMKCGKEEVEIILDIIQTFEPSGVGARNLKECLAIQVKNKMDANHYIITIIEDYLEDLGYNRIQKISKELNLDLKEVQEACDYIKRLEPKPGSSFRSDSEDIRYIIPDAEIQLIDGEFVVILNDVTGPRLNINNYYKGLMKSGGDKKTIDFLNEKFNSAMWIIRSIEQRRNTIKRVIESILKFQKNFFIEGEIALKPLTLKDIADDIDMHESTISRATNGKYVQTPRGLFELKYFFSSGILGDEGDVSSTSIKVKLKDIIDNEDTKKPYSDQKISELLKMQGINISRRTVAKYRDELCIPSSSMRRRY